MTITKVTVGAISTERIKSITNNEVLAARGNAADLDTRLDAITIGGSNVATLANGVAAAGQKIITVDSTVDFVAGASVAYVLVGGAIEYNTIDTVDSGAQLTMVNNIGTGGIADNGIVSQVPLGIAEISGSNYNTPADRVNAIDGWPTTMRLNGSNTGSTVNVKGSPTSDVKGVAVFSPFSVVCEVRQISSSGSNQVTLANALVNSHADDGAVLIFRSLNKLPAEFFGLSASASSSTNKTAIKTALSQLQYLKTGTITIPSGTYSINQNGTNDAITLTSNQHIEMQPDTVLTADPEAVVTGNNYIFFMSSNAHNMSIRGGKIIGDRDDNPLNVGIAVSELSYNIAIRDVVIESCGTGIAVVAGDASQNGTVVSATASTIVFESSAPSTDDALIGMHVGIVTGNGRYQARRITDYTGSTRTATLGSNWHTTPTTSNNYHIFHINDLIIDNVAVRDCFRNGMGFTEGYNTVVTNSIFGYTIGTSPQAGIDFEPNVEGAIWNLKVTNCVFEHNGAVGLYIQNGLSDIGIGAILNVQVSGCTFSQNTDGLIVDRSINPVITNNTFVQNAAVAAQISYSTGIVVAGNTASHNDGTAGLGDITIISCENGSVSSNVVRNSVNGHGIAFSVGGDTNRQCSALSVSGNSVSDCDGHGYLIDGVASSDFSGNVARGCNGAGIQVEQIGGVYSSVFSSNLLVGNCQDGSETRQFYLGRGVNNWIAGNIAREYFVVSGGILQSATATTAVLDADTAILTDDIYNNLTIEIVSGTGSGQTQTVTDYVSSTKTITVASWGTQPDNTSHYIIYDGSSGTRALLFGTQAHANYYHGNDFRFSGGGASSVQDFTGGDNIDGGDNQIS